MPTMTHRTTFALDDATARRLKRMAARWRVSQAEVVRRSLEEAERRADHEGAEPATLLRELHRRGGGLAPEAAVSYLAEVRESRKKWRGR